ncbi:MAG TPA: Hsp20/alpha crystallin family protein [Solirubrobacteraceae bacterium]|jgi:HSP20 family protein|nr:Hsp20/alpha crystallin family protein [Solirubrobacteraceae bacterium]
MAVIRWEPVRELHSLQQEMNRLFGSFLESPSAGSSTATRQWIPAMDLVERDEQFVLRADLPGVREADVTIEVEDNVLTIAGERRSEHEENREGYHRIERATGAFRRSLTLPDGVDASSIGAKFDGGVLEVTIPKPKQRRPERVQINLGGSDQPPVIEADAVAAAA